MGAAGAGIREQGRGVRLGPVVARRAARSVR